MYTVYDFINDDISEKRMRFGWKIEMKHTRTYNSIILRYIMLNFDWNSLEFIGNDLWDMFLKSKSFSNMKKRMDNANRKFKRTYFEACSIDHLRWLMEREGLEIDLDKLIEKTVERKSEKVKEKIERIKEIENNQTEV